MLPPTQTSLLPNIKRANYIAMRDKSYHVRHPALPQIEDNGWKIENGMHTPVRCFALPVPAPKVVIELTKCNCKTGCMWLLYKHSLPCTPLCKCYGSECANPIRSVAPRIEDDE